MTKTAELYAEVKVADESEHLDDKTPVYRANFTRSGKGGRGGFRGSYHKGGGNRGGPGYQGKSGNFKGSKAQMECYYCHKPGHLISECRKRIYNDKHRNNSDSSSSADNSTNWRNNSSNGNSNSNSSNGRNSNSNKTPLKSRISNNNGQNDESGSTSFQWRANVTTHSTTVSNPPSNALTWIVDSASNANLTPYLERIDEYVKFEHPQVIKGIGGMTIDALGSGSIIITDWNNREVTIDDVFYVPKATDPILSMQKLRKNDVRIVFDNDERDIDKFILNSYDEDFNLAGRAIDNILYVTEPEESYRSLQVSTRAQKRRRLDRTDDVLEPVDFRTKKQSRGRRPIKKKNGNGPLTADLGPSTIKPAKRTNSPLLNSSQIPVKEPSNQDHRLWHLRLGHASASTLAKLPWLSSTYDTNDCESCIFAKAHKTPFSTVEHRTTAKLELVHSDLCGPLPASIGGFLYFITFTDDLTRYSWVYPIVDKKASTIEKVFDTWIRDAENKAGTKVKYFRTDGGGEYEKELKEHLRTLGITHETTAPYSPQQNGVSERLNRTLNEMVRAMLLEANMPDCFWPDAILFAADIKNILPHSSIPNSTPYGLFLDEFPKYDILRPFGCIVYPTIPKERMPKASKYRPRAYKGALVSNISSGTWRFWDFKRGEYDVISSAIFKETVFPEESDFANLSLLPHEPSSRQRKRVSTRREPSTPRREPTPPVRQPTPEIFDEIVVLPGPPPTALKSEATTAPMPSTSIFDPLPDPLTYDEATSRHDAEHWIKAMEAELQSIEENKTWTLSRPPRDRRVIGTKWVFKTKRDGNNNFLRYKARLVAKGYSQIAGLDFEETYAPVVRIDSVRCLFAIAAFFGLHIIHVDAKTAFLNGDSDLELYVVQPEGFEKNGAFSSVLRLNKSLYGLKQAPRIWYLLLCNYILSIGFTCLDSDPSIYYHTYHRVFIAVYVDDILIFGVTDKSCNDVYESLASQFNMQNLGNPTTFLGLNIVRDDTTITINQTGYIERMLHRFNMTNSRPAKTPLDPSLPLLSTQQDDKRADTLLYQEIVGSLNHLAVYSRPDISYAVSKLSQFLIDPNETHMSAARHVLRYLKYSHRYSITYGRASNLNILGYADADWGSDENDRTSFTGYVFMINNGAVTWTAHKQSSVALSTMEAEYMSLSDASREAIARQHFFDDLRILINTPVLHSDNQAALSIVLNPVQYQRSKHIAIRYHFIRQAAQNNMITIDYVSTDEQIADVLTKALKPIKHLKAVNLLRLC